MMGITIQVVSNRAPELQGRMRQRGGVIVAQTARRVEAGAKTLAPVDTGALKNSILASQVRDFTWEVGVGVAYAAYVEYGTSRMAARPYLTPAAERQREPFLAALAELIDG
jgi:HK97 gp10 family phage protein